MDPIPTECFDIITLGMSVGCQTFSQGNVLPTATIQHNMPKLLHTFLHIEKSIRVKCKHSRCETCHVLRNFYQISMIANMKTCDLVMIGFNHETQFGKTNNTVAIIAMKL